MFSRRESWDQLGMSARAREEGAMAQGLFICQMWKCPLFKINIGHSSYKQANIWISSSGVILHVLNTFQPFQIISPVDPILGMYLCLKEKHHGGTIMKSVRTAETYVSSSGTCQYWSKWFLLVTCLNFSALLNRAQLSAPFYRWGCWSKSRSGGQQVRYTSCALNH